MLSSIRKFSTSIYAKILLGIIIIPFVFWGMGSSFTSGSRNVVVVIDKEKYSTQDLADFIQKFGSANQEIDTGQIEELLSIFIGEKLIEKELDYFGIKLSDESLGQLIKHQKGFKRENKFSRTEYEKFLLENNISAVIFEANLAKNEKKKQLLDFIGGGILPSKFLVNASYNEINQKRNIQVINLNDLFKKEFNFSIDRIKSYYENNKDNYKEIYKSVKIFELNPKALTGIDEFNNIFFKKIDEIDEIIIQGENLDYIMQKFNLEKANTFTFNKFGKDINTKKIIDLPQSLIKNIFTLNDTESTALIEIKDKYFIIEIIKTENIENGPEDETVKKKIMLDLEMKTKRKLIAEIISKIVQNNFTKTDFDKLSNDKNLLIKKVRLENQNDNKILKKILVNKIYAIPEKKIIVVNDINLTESFLVYVDKVENVTISEQSEEYKKYVNLSKIKITNGLFNTYDEYIKKKYKININYKALDIVKNYFN